MKRRRRPLWEWPFIFAILAISALLALSAHRFNERQARQQALHEELKLLRTGEILYASINGRIPENLEDLTDEGFCLPGDEADRRFVERPPRIAEGMFVDPFGNPYRFEQASGWIKSTTPGYEFW